MLKYKNKMLLTQQIQFLKRDKNVEYFINGTCMKMAQKIQIFFYVINIEKITRSHPICEKGTCPRMTTK